MKRLKFISKILLLFLLFSCKNNYEIIKDTLPKGSIKLRYQVQNQVTDNLLLELIDLNDSRCPVGVICADAGSVKIDISVLSSRGSGTATLYFSEIPDPVQNADTVAGCRIEAVEVYPIPYLNKPIETDSIYSVYVLVQEL